MKAVNLFKKRRVFPSLIASLSFFLILLPSLSLSGQGFSLHPTLAQVQLQEEGQSSPPPDIPPPATESEKSIQEGEAVPEAPPVQEQAQPQKGEAVPEAPPVQEQAQPQTPSESPPTATQIEKKAAGEERVGPSSGPPIMLALKQAIKIALAGNRPYLDRIDLIRQRQGLGGAEQLIQLSGGGNLTIPAPSGVATAEAQFQTFVSPSLSVTRGQVAGSSEETQIESYSLGISKSFITGGSLSLSPNVSSTKFERFSSSLSANFSQPLLRNAWPFVVGEPITAAKSDLLKEELNARCCDETSRQGLIFNVISQYYGIKNTSELVEITKKAVERAERLYKATKAKQNVELATQLDVSRAEVQLSTQEVAYSTALQDLGNKEETFKVLLGLNTREKFVLTDEIVYLPSEAAFKEEDLPKFIETAIKNRPDLRAQQIRVEDADRRLRIARNALLPDLFSNFNYTINNVGGMNNAPLVEANSKSWSGQLTLSYPLPITTTKINIETQAVQLRREDRTLVEKKENVIRDVRNDLRNVIRLQEQIPIVKGQVESAEKKLKIANFRFDRGLASNFDIVDAENNLIFARQSITKSIADYLVAKYQLKRDIGMLQDEE